MPRAILLQPFHSDQHKNRYFCTDKKEGKQVYSFSIVHAKERAPGKEVNKGVTSSVYIESHSVERCLTIETKRKIFSAFRFFVKRSTEHSHFISCLLTAHFMPN